MAPTRTDGSLSDEEGDRPREKFSVPAPMIIAGRKNTSEKSRSTDGVAQETSSMPPPVPTKSITNNNNGNKAAALATGDGGEELLPPPPPVKKRDGAGQDGVGGSGKYVPPSWGLTTAPTSTGLSLSVLKGGAEVGSISLDNRTHFLFGRQQGVVDILLEHPSISRKHAILQLGQKGSLFLFDNGSTHGCKVNKEKIPPNEFHRLHVGDVVKFGESTRLYVVEGPEELRPPEYESENLHNLRLKAGRKQLAAKLAKIKAGGEGGVGDSGEYGISWGFDEDAVDEDDEADEADGADGADGEVELPDYLKTEAQKRRRHDTRSGLTEDSVHKRDAKLFDKLQVKLTKVEHLLTENERITAKEGAQGGLTEGQQAQLARNDRAIAAVRLQIEELEDTIRSKNKARERSKEGGDEGEGGSKSGERTEGGRGHDGEGDDDYYDRTAPVVPASSRKLPGGVASKKAEVRARRFAPKDKTKKMVVVGGARAGGGLGAEVSAGGAISFFSSEGDDGTAAQSLEALKRLAEVVAGDLERTDAGLAELQAEEIEEEQNAKTPEGGQDAVAAAADPLDRFMASNRRSERQQAMTRLSARRDALQKEKERLRVMVEAATPSMPTLKAVVTSVDESTRAIVPEVSPVTHEEAKGEETRDDMALAGGNGDDDNSHSGSLRNNGPEASRDDPASGRPFRSPALASVTEPAATSRSPVSGAHTADVVFREKPTTLSSGSNVEGCEQETVRNSQEALEQSSGAKKRRGTPVEGVMLPPPPPARRSKHAGNENGVIEEGKKQALADLDKDGDVPRRAVKGPAAMPPSSAKTSASAERARREAPAELATGDKTSGEEGRKSAGETRGAEAVVASEKAILEGGDADWVPPKGQAGDGRTALNAKFGY